MTFLEEKGAIGKAKVITSHKPNSEAVATSKDLSLLTSPWPAADTAGKHLVPSEVGITVHEKWD